MPRWWCRWCPAAATGTAAAAAIPTTARTTATLAFMVESIVFSFWFGWSCEEARNGALERRSLPRPLGGRRRADHDGRSPGAGDDAGDLAVTAPCRRLVDVDHAGAVPIPESNVGRGVDGIDVHVALIAVVVEPEAGPVRQRLRALPRRRVEVTEDRSARRPDGGGEGAPVGSDRMPVERIGKACHTAREPAGVPGARRRRRAQPDERLRLSRLVRRPRPRTAARVSAAFPAATCE